MKRKHKRGEDKAPGDLKRRRLRADVDPVVWILLDRYLVVINDHLARNNWPPVSQARLMGAILTRFVLSYAEHINENYARIEIGRLRLGMEQLDARAAAHPRRPRSPPTGG